MTKRLRADGEDPRVFRTLVEEGVNLHVELIPRSRFKHMVEGSARSAFRYSFFTRRQLVYCDDPSLARWFEEADTVARRDQERELCIATTWLIHAHRHAARLLENGRDLDLAFQEWEQSARSKVSLPGRGGFGIDGLRRRGFRGTDSG